MEELSRMAGSPDLNSYDYILVNSSAGKDSQAMLDYVVELADAQGVDREKLVVVHCDLGRVEWAGTKDLARRQTAHYGLRFEVVKRPQGDLLEHVESRGMWPSSAARYCTSDHKRGQVRTLMTKLADTFHGGRKRSAGRPVRILNCMGLRAEESDARAKRVEFRLDESASNGRRHVDEWLPIHRWTVDEVWARIHASGVEYHYAYKLGMPRLSCVFCIFAPESALILAGIHNRELLDEYVRVEQKIDHTFKANLALIQIQQKVDAGVVPDIAKIKWAQCA